MADKREKTLSYRRAEWLEEPPGSLTLEQLLKSAHRKLKSVAERTILRDTGQCIRSVKKKEPQTGGIFVHLTVDTPGEAASVIPKIKVGQEEIDVGTAAPPPDSEFMDGDAFLFVVDNHVCLCSSGVRDGAIRLFLYEFFKKADLGDAATMFDLMKVANVSKLKMLHAQGVKEIELKATLYQA
jgi:hypothetical protein